MWILLMSGLLFMIIAALNPKGPPCVMVLEDYFDEFQNGTVYNMTRCLDCCPCEWKGNHSSGPPCPPPAPYAPPSNYESGGGVFGGFRKL